VRKARRAKASAERCHEAEKAGLPEPESSETLVSEIEGGEDLHWLNELVDEEDEDEEIPLLAGDRGPRGSEVPEVSQVLGGARVAPYIIVDDEEDGALQGGSVPLDPQ